ncbi:hypothetical protein [Paenibacillus sp. YIM B09110]|uniref:hypothetical protein n=1 Tax=Paenibacillus sp. YIM B09110 TaxID=3126102 RepID=UPI00301B895F
MGVQQEAEYKAFLESERSRYRSGLVTGEEKESFLEELKLLRSFRMDDQVAPYTTYRGGAGR